MQREEACLTLILLTWRIWWAPNNASKWQMGFNSEFKGLKYQERFSRNYWHLLTSGGRITERTAVAIACCGRPHTLIYNTNFACSKCILSLVNTFASCFGTSHMPSSGSHNAPQMVRWCTLLYTCTSTKIRFLHVRLVRIIKPPSAVYTVLDGMF